MKFLFTLLFALFSFSMFAQDISGVISYREEIPNPKAEEMRERMKARGFQVDIPDVNIENKNLYFTKEESIYKNKPKKEKEYEGKSMGSKGISIRFSSSDASSGYYRKLGSNEYVQEKDIMGKPFLIVDDESKYEWKITGKTEQLGNYQVMEATTTDGEDVIQAWFTPQIPVATGPGRFSQLPGVILRVDINQGERLIYATNIDLRPLTQEETIKEPKKGKKMKKEKFLALQKEKLEELKEMYGKKRGGMIMGK